MVTLAVPQLQLPGGGRAGHQPWHRGELEGLKPGWHPAWITPQPRCKQQLCRDLWEAGPGLLLSKGHHCPGAGLVISMAFSSAELTSTFTSNPLLFPGSFPVSQLSVSELAAQPLLTRFLVTKNTLSHHGAFPRHFSPIFHQRGACRVCVPTLIPGECFFQSLSHPGPVPGRGAGTLPSPCLQALLFLQDALNPVSHPDSCFNISAVSGGGRRQHSPGSFPQVSHSYRSSRVWALLWAGQGRWWLFSPCICQESPSLDLS